MSAGGLAAARSWEAADSADALALTRRYEAAWRESDRRRRPDPRDYLPLSAESRPGVLLALLRTDLRLRLETNGPARVEVYRERYPELSEDDLVALIYEEHCLFEDAGLAPDPTEAEARFPDLKDRLRRVFAIHELVGLGSIPLPDPTPAEPALPEAGQTIAGFTLVEELGRGSFARVFLARERQLADRPVVLKVSRVGSREPLTLARLQHTHIVPIHSYRVDPATDLHLLCMPFLGRVTLAQVLADPSMREARSGADLVAAVERLAPEEAIPSGRAIGHIALRSRDFVRAIAWWGARLAEALQFAHDRGVTHGDVKPSNVLITADGLPMLLDFNLARGPLADGPDPTPGGTVAYMAPEQLRALADGSPSASDEPADIYAMGVVLFEAMGARPFEAPTSGPSLAETLSREADRRRASAPRLRDRYPEAPPAFEAIVLRCLAPAPLDRYATAGDLAADLQAVADDAPLRHAREPLGPRLARRLHRHRVGLGLATILALGVVSVGSNYWRSSLGDVRRVAEVQHWLALAKRSLRQNDPGLAEGHFAAAAELAARGVGPKFDDLRARARERARLAGETRRVRTLADTLHAEIEPLRLKLRRSGGPQGKDAVRSALGRFYVLENPDWASLPELSLLDPKRRSQLLDDVDDLLFLLLLADDDSRDPRVIRRSVLVCDHALKSSRRPGPWHALRARWAARLLGEAASRCNPGVPDEETSARACGHWAALLDREGRRVESMAWLSRAVALEPLAYGPRLDLARHLARAGRFDRAAEHFAIAAALCPDSTDARSGLIEARLRIADLR